MAQDIATLLANQKQAFLTQGHVPAELRKARIQRVIDVLVKYHEQLTKAMDADFGGRHPGFSTMYDILGSLGSLKHVRDNLEGWMGDEPRPVTPPYDQLGGETWIRYQPKGSIGILGTWNTPVYTVLSPLACVLGAGNRAIIKPSEVTPRTADILAAAFADMIDPLDVAIVTGDAQCAKAMTQQPFDHLVFTGGTEIAKSVMRNAAQNLVPLTLELGGKSPCIIGRSADLEEAAYRLAVAKSTNGGQVCVCPDTVYLPEEELETFLTLLRGVFAQILPDMPANPDATSIVNSRHAQRLEAYLADAKSRGIRTEALSSGKVQQAARPGCKSIEAVINPDPEALISQHEIFGPAFVLRTYTQVDDAINAINAGPRPLALYYFGQDDKEQAHVLDHTISGGVCLNDALAQSAMHDVPFGGIGASGMGHYHGHEGFKEFSHMRTVFKAPKADMRAEWGTVPPYPDWYEDAMKAQVTP